MSKAKQLVKIGLITAIAGLYSAGVSAASVNGRADAEIIKPLTLTAGAAMNFGILAVDAATGGDVILDLANGRTAGGGGGVDLVAGGTISSGQFTIDGLANQAFTLTTSPTAVVDDGGGLQMTVNITGENGNAVTLTGAPDAFAVSGTLVVPAGQAVGVYSTTTGGTPYTVTANYD